MTEAITEPPATYQELRTRLQDRQSTMAAGQRRIARLLLDDPEGTAFRSIGETARLAQVHSSSLVRFAAMFGLSGYPGLVRLCREQLASEAQLVHRLDRARRHTATDELLGAVVEHDQRNLARTFAQLDHADWDRAVALLADAPAVSVIGLRKCFSVAYLMSYLLHLVRPRVRQIGGGGGLLVDELRELDPADVLVAVSIRRYARDTVRAVEYARRVGVVVVALTDDPSSPLAPLADVTFYVSTAGVTVLRSLSVFTSLVQALATAVAVRLGTSSRDELLTDERLLSEFETYVEPS